jgi:hypothetical protein
MPKVVNVNGKVNFLDIGAVVNGYKSLPYGAVSQGDPWLPCPCPSEVACEADCGTCDEQSTNSGEPCGSDDDVCEGGTCITCGSGKCTSDALGIGPNLCRDTCRRCDAGD